MENKILPQCETCDLRGCETIICTTMNAQHAISLIIADSWVFRRVYNDGTPIAEPDCWAYVAREDGAE